MLYGAGIHPRLTRVQLPCTDSPLMSTLVITAIGRLKCLGHQVLLRSARDNTSK